ncbi:MAG: hypothetical protein LOD90_01015 [Symbiobacteriaceae bacterium]
MHSVMRLVALLALAALLAACTGSGFPAYPTMEEALGEVLDTPIAILYVAPFDRNRSLVLFKAGDHGPTATLLERMDLGQWRMTEAVALGGPLPRLGALSYGRANLGYLEEKIGTVTHVKAETHVVFGEVLDPAITWVELTLDREGAEPTRARVDNGFWVVHLPPENQLTGFALNAGDDGGVRFSASVGRGRAHGHASAADAPLVEYRDEQQGIRLEHPVVAAIPLVEEGRLTLPLDERTTLTVERRTELVGRDLDELLRDAAAQAGERALEHGIGQLGAHQAAYVLEVEQEENGQGATYRARYLTVTGDAGYEVVCSVTRVYEWENWERMARPICDRVLATVRLGSAP